MAIIPNDFPVQQFLTQMNSLVDSIKFTYETQNNNNISFLDLLICQNDTNLSFKIHRKPTSCNQLLHAFSDHPNYIKQNIIFNTFFQSLRFTDPFFFYEEITFIY